MWAAVERGPHISALDPATIAQLKGEIADKVRVGQCKVVEWDSIKDNPPEQLKISPLAMIPHKSRQFRAILDLSFRLKLKTGVTIPSVNESTNLEAPAGAIDQMGHALQRITHAFAEADPEAKIFMAKFDIKDGFSWRLDCQEGEEWNFAYVLPLQQEPHQSPDFSTGGGNGSSSSSTSSSSSSSSSSSRSDSRAPRSLINTQKMARSPPRKGVIMLKVVVRAVVRVVVLVWNISAKRWSLPTSIKFLTVVFLFCRKVSIDKSTYTLFQKILILK
jgi:hypothetical protein